MNDVGIFNGRFVYIFCGHLVHFCGHLVHFVVILYIFFRFGALSLEKSGNPGLAYRQGYLCFEQKPIPSPYLQLWQCMYVVTGVRSHHTSIHPRQSVVYSVATE
jgi:hypothetical protein